MVPEAPWVTSLDAARAIWPDAPTSDRDLADVLAAAQAVCQEYAPTLPVGATAPAGWGRAVVLQAREVWAAARRDGDVLGVDVGYAVRSRPLLPAVRLLLRPRRPVGALR